MLKQIINLRGRYKKILPGFLAFLTSSISYYELEFGNHTTDFPDLKYVILNILTLYSISLVFFIISRKWWIACGVTGTAWTILSIANYQAVLYRWLPISTQDLYNFKTALDVVSAYKIILRKRILFCYLVIILITLMIKKLEKEKCNIKNHVKQSMVFLLILSLYLYKGYFAQEPIKPFSTISWIWEESYYKYGYVASSMEILLTSLNPVKKPEGYSKEKMEQIVQEFLEEAPGEEIRKPDIILILNESFYDLRLITDIKPDRPFMENIDKMGNTIRGYAVVPNIGGGTNLSEYELLTSNSMELLQGITPFNSLKLNGANSIVSFLKNKGYQTAALHGSVGPNYNRTRAYPALGFDQVKFIDELTDIELYGERQFITDDSLYSNMVNMEKQMDENSPHFIYCLTMQNHGSWDTNDNSQDLVHTKNDFKEYNEIINEYLSCIYKTDQAFKELTDLYKASDREVIICMVGDHAPYFASDIVNIKQLDLKGNIYLRSTPYILWANFPIEEKIIGEISMPYIVPNLLKAAGLNLSVYYEHLLKQKKLVPIITSTGSYVDYKTIEYKYNDFTPYTNLINDYFFMEYNNIVYPEEFRKELFLDI